MYHNLTIKPWNVIKVLKTLKMLPKTFYGLMHDQKTSFVFKILLTSDELFFLNTFKCHGQVYPLINQTDRSRF